MGVCPHPGNHLAVTSHAVVTGDLRIEIMDADRFVEPARGERRAVIPAVDGFGCVFSDKIMRRMAIVAGGGPVMRRPVPPVVLVAHDMTIVAGAGIV